MKLKKYRQPPALPLSIVVDTSMVLVIKFTRSSENMTSDLKVEDNEIQTCLRFLAAAPMTLYQHKTFGAQ